MDDPELRKIEKQLASQINHMVLSKLNIGTRSIGVVSGFEGFLLFFF